MAQLSALVPDSLAGEKDRDYLALMDGHDGALEVVQRFTAMVSAPVMAERMAALYRRFDELGTADVDDPRVDQLAADIADDVAGALLPSGLVLPGVDPGEEPFGAALLADLAPAQAEVLRLTYLRVSEGGGRE